MIWTILPLVVLVFALLALAVAVREALAIRRAVPEGHPLRSKLWMDWWKFGAIEAAAGPAAQDHVSIYKRSAIAFVVLILLGLMLGSYASSIGRV